MNNTDNTDLARKLEKDGLLALIQVHALETAQFHMYKKAAYTSDSSDNRERFVEMTKKASMLMVKHMAQIQEMIDKL